MKYPKDGFSYEVSKFKCHICDGNGEVTLKPDTVTARCPSCEGTGFLVEMEIDGRRIQYPGGRIKEIVLNEKEET